MIHTVLVQNFDGQIGVPKEGSGMYRTAVEMVGSTATDVVLDEKSWEAWNDLKHPSRRFFVSESADPDPSAYFGPLGLSEEGLIRAFRFKYEHVEDTYADLGEVTEGRSVLVLGKPALLDVMEPRRGIVIEEDDTEVDPWEVGVGACRRATEPIAGIKIKHLNFEVP